MHDNAINTTNAKVQQCIDLYDHLMSKVTDLENYYFACGVSLVEDTVDVGQGVTFGDLRNAITSLIAIRDLGISNGRAHLTNLYKTR
ncbi:MAG: hypothetical protein WCX94_02690 [Candidatus Dojkabacteria bacterium]|jgi:hypothetical protein|nr:hypothetical protein [Candidatus Dojkabacteria bacterium]